MIGPADLPHGCREGADPQTPHDQDELYIVVSGTGTFVRGAERVSFGPHEVLFAAAHEMHRFEHLSDDFATWVVFYGPVGGESPRSSSARRNRYSRAGGTNRSPAHATKAGRSRSGTIRNSPYSPLPRVR